MRRELNELEIKEIKDHAREKLGICRKTNDVIGSQIFSILGLYARVIYYPFGKDAPWGFIRISGSRNDAALDKPFVAINTSIPVPCQVFAAVHELYHIWYEHNPDVLPSDLLDEDDKEINEKKANRFAAEFLIDEMMLRQEIQTYGIKKFDIKSVLQLADLFTVPYRAMAKRLFETGFIKAEEKDILLSESDESIARLRKRYAFSAGEADNRIAVDNLADLFTVPYRAMAKRLFETGFIKAEDKDTLLSESDESIAQFRKRYAFFAGEADNRIAVDNLADLSVKAYEQELITFEKLEYLLGMCGLKSEDIGIQKTSGAAFPSDEELDEIMEGDE